MFDGSCRLIPVEVIADECVTLSNQFIVQLVDTLSSEMNPQIVCAVAGKLKLSASSGCNFRQKKTILILFSGLCNSARVDRLIALSERQESTECGVCKRESQKLADKISGMAPRDLEDKLLEACGHAGSYADACKATVIDNFEILQG